MSLTACGRADGIARLVERNLSFIAAQFVHSFALIFSVLLLIQRDDSQRRICELVSRVEVRDFVILVVRQEEFVFDPNDLWRRIRLDMTFLKADNDQIGGSDAIYGSFQLTKSISQRRACPSFGRGTVITGENSISKLTFRRSPLPTPLSAKQ